VTPKKDLVQFKVRIPRGLLRRIEAEGRRNNCSANYEAAHRLRRSFEMDKLRQLDELVTDMNVVWARFSSRFVLLGLEEDLAQAIMQAEDIQQVKALARAWLMTKKTATKMLEGSKP